MKSFKEYISEETLEESRLPSDLDLVKQLVGHAEDAFKKNNKTAYYEFMEAIRKSGDTLQWQKHAQKGAELMGIKR